MNILTIPQNSFELPVAFTPRRFFIGKELMGNKNLRAADRNKNDEFYTTYEDIKKRTGKLCKIF